MVGGVGGLGGGGEGGGVIEGRRSLNPSWFAGYKFKVSVECENEVDELNERFKTHMKRVENIKNQIKVFFIYLFFIFMGVGMKIDR